MTNSILTNAVAVSDGKVTTTSLKIAEVFGKRHDNVIQSIQSLQVPDEWHALNFQEMQTEVKVGNGATRPIPAYRITRDGFTLLVMGFTGAKAMQFKIAYLEAFNRMEAELVKLRHGIAAGQPELPFNSPAPEAPKFNLKMRYRGRPVAPTPLAAKLLRVSEDQLRNMIRRVSFNDPADIIRIKGVTNDLTLAAARAGILLLPQTISMNLFTESGLAKLEKILDKSKIKRHDAIEEPEAVTASPFCPAPKLNLPRKGETTGKSELADVSVLLEVFPQDRLGSALRALSEAGYCIDGAMNDYLTLIGFAKSLYETIVSPCKRSSPISNLEFRRGGSLLRDNILLFDQNGGSVTGETAFNRLWNWRTTYNTKERIQKAARA